MGHRLSKTRAFNPMYERPDDDDQQHHCRRHIQMRYSHPLIGPTNGSSTLSGWLRHLKRTPQSDDVRRKPSTFETSTPPKETVEEKRTKRLRRRTAPPGFHRGWEFVMYMTGTTRHQEERYRYERIANWVADIIQAGAVGPDAEDAISSNDTVHTTSYLWDASCVDGQHCFLDGGRGFDRIDLGAYHLNVWRDRSTGTLLRRHSMISSKTSHQKDVDEHHDTVDKRPVTWLGPIPPARPAKQSAHQRQLTRAKTFVVSKHDDDDITSKLPQVQVTSVDATSTTTTEQPMTPQQPLPSPLFVATDATPSKSPPSSSQQTTMHLVNDSSTVHLEPTIPDQGTAMLPISDASTFGIGSSSQPSTILSMQ
jgi:hypothetical protein